MILSIIDGQRLKEKMVTCKLTLSVAESLTCGNVQASIGSISGASNFFEGGITVYNLKQKVAHLGIDEAHAAKVDCVSQYVAEEMARGVCVKFESDIGVATTGYAEPYPDEYVEIPHAYFAICRHNKEDHQFSIVANGRIDGEGLTRVEMQHHVTQQVVQSLMKYVMNV